mgnify:CR=1 FL=1
MKSYASVDINQIYSDVLKIAAHKDITQQGQMDRVHYYRQKYAWTYKNGDYWTKCLCAMIAGALGDPDLLYEWQYVPFDLLTANKMATASFKGYLVTDPATKPAE